jgi:hypothetical protein
MQVLHTYDDAFRIAQPYINSITTTYDDETNEMVDYLFRNHEDPVPINATYTRWRMTDEALHNTLDYIFHKLAHNCYMLCIKDNVIQMYKLVSSRPSESMNNAIAKHVAKLSRNVLITPQQIDFINDFTSEPVRIMQCIMKHYDQEDQINDNEYLYLLKQIVLPNGVYIMNLTDAVILHNNNQEPFPMVTGEGPLEKRYDSDYHIPILSISGQQRYSDIVIPNYDDIRPESAIRASKNYITNWQDKKIHKAVFRGGPSGCGYTVQTNQRLKLLTINSPLVDAKIVSKTGSIDSKAIKFDPKYGLGMSNTGLKSGNFLSMTEQSNYKYIIHVDGNVNAYRLLTSMLTGSVILRVESQYKYTSWVDHLIEHNEHYIRVDPDLSNLVSQIEWCERNPHIAKKIAENGMEFARKALNIDYILDTIQKIFWSIPTTHKPYTARTHTRLHKPRTPELLPDRPARSPHSPEGPEKKKISSPRSPDGPPPPLKKLSPRSPDGPPPPRSPSYSPPSLKIKPRSPDGPPPPNLKIKPRSPDGPPPPNLKINSPIEHDVEFEISEKPKKKKTSKTTKTKANNAKGISKKSRKKRRKPQ